LSGARALVERAAQEFVSAGLPRAFLTGATALDETLPAAAWARATAWRMARLRRLLAVRSWPMMILSG
jgi:hypothetical protein